MNLQNWYENEVNAAHLAELLSDPVLNRAFAVIETANSPVFRAGAQPADLATLHAFQAGVHHVRRTLHLLTQPPAHKTEPLSEWEGDHIFDQQQP
jgi:hypothetical protein